MLHCGAYRPSTKKVPKQLQISVAFRPRREEAIPNLVPEAEKSKDAALCNDNRNSLNASKDQYPNAAKQLWKMSTVGESEIETM